MKTGFSWHSNRTCYPSTKNTPDLELCVEMHCLDIYAVSYPGADLMEAGGNGFGRRVTAEHMAF